MLGGAVANRVRILFLILAATTLYHRHKFSFLQTQHSPSDQGKRDREVEGNGGIWEERRISQTRFLLTSAATEDWKMTEKNDVELN